MAAVHYYCNNCHGSVDLYDEECRHCHVKLGAAFCSNCYFIAASEQFIGGRCPNCKVSDTANSKEVAKIKMPFKTLDLSSKIMNYLLKLMLFTLFTTLLIYYIISFVLHE